jgi:hypothetical protein
MNESNCEYDAGLVREIRRMALEGAQPADLIRCIQERQGYAPDYIVPVLAYLRHTFDVSLRTILPLREEMGVGPESRALRVVFWFAAAMLANEDYLPWDWQRFQAKSKNGFTVDNLAAWPASIEGTKLEYRETGDGIIARGALTIVIDFDEAFDLPDNDIRERIRAFAEQYRQMLTQTVNGTAGDYSTRMTLDFEMHPDGPKCRVVCMIQSLKELLENKQQPSLASV